MDFKLKPTNLLVSSQLTALLLCTTPIVAIASEPAKASSAINDTIAAIADLYKITEEEAVTRLVRENDAAIQAGLLHSLDVPSYAGSWYDDTVGKLVVAVANPNDVKLVSRLDVVTVIVEHSLRELEQDRAALIADLESSEYSTSVISDYVDYELNSVVIDVSEGTKEGVEGLISSARGSSQYVVQESQSLPQLSGTPVRAAMETGNVDQPLLAGQTFPCSVGAAVNGGFVTAGHCGELDDEIVDGSGTSLGDTDGSTWPFPGPSTPRQTIDADVGIVDTLSGWTPSATIQGYTDGVFSVSPLWGGLTPYGVNTTVCRYGGTSGGPHCGQVDALNVTQQFGGAPITGSGGVRVRGLTRVRNTCSEDGDSGGPYVAGVGVIQGTNVGIQLAGTTCPSDYDGWFQPISDNLDEWSVTLLTSHGANAPSVTQVKCPDLDNSGLGSYQCQIMKVDAQGSVTQSWSANTGGSTSSRVFNASCSSGQTVTATLKLFNQYGTTTENYSFQCPMGPIP